MTLGETLTGLLPGALTYKMQGQAKPGFSKEEHTGDLGGTGMNNCKQTCYWYRYTHTYVFLIVSFDVWQSFSLMVISFLLKNLPNKSKF